MNVSEKDAEGNQGDQGNILEIPQLSLALIFFPFEAILLYNYLLSVMWIRYRPKAGTIGLYLKIF